MSLEHSPARSSGRRLIRWKDVLERTRRSRSQIWRDIRAGRFPAPLQTGENSVAFDEAEVEEWLKRLPRVAYASEVNRD